MNTITLIGQNDSLGEEVMTTTIRKKMSRVGSYHNNIMAHNLPLLYESFILGGIYCYKIFDYLLCFLDYHMRRC